MVGRPGRLQSAWTAGELEPLLHERTEIKYFGTGAKRMENVEIAPQGGFRGRDGLRRIGAVAADAAKIFPFDASNGASYDLVFSPNNAQVWSATTYLFDIIGIGLTATMLPEFTVAQQLDTMLLFHNDLETRRIKHLGPTNWAVDNAPFTGVPNYDYGGVYTNGVPAVWELEFVGLSFTPGAESVFTLTVSGQETVSIEYGSDMLILAARVQAAVLDLPNTAAGITVLSSSGDATGKKILITFGGANNSGDGWAISARVINKADAAVLALKITPGVAPGEPLFSAARGYAHCGVFYGQRLLIGGFKSLPNAWMMSKVSEYFNYDDRFTEANGPALIPMDVPGGERIERLVSSRSLLVFTTKAEYWIAERALSKTQAPNHVQSSRNGTRRGVPVIENEGAAIFCHANGGVLGETRYTDVEGNFVSTDISLLASHLIRDVRHLAVRRATISTDGNIVGVVTGPGEARLATILREQDVTAFARMTTDGLFRAVSVNGRNEMSWLVDRPAGRQLERSEDGLLLDEAIDFSYGTPQTFVSGLEIFNGRTVWCIGDRNVFGPFVVSGGVISLPRAISFATVGTWKPPIVETLPPPRTIGPNLVMKRKARIHSVQLSVLDTTSIAIAVNGKPLKDLNLVRYGALADVPELDAPFTGTIPIRGLTGYVDEPTVTISQIRPGRFTVRSITIEAAL
ncbi:hypothetical protein LJR231_002265 [Phyllobacterium sp. LjRoot231]|uniref:hypothetical protein n=1 Tax=Phyllobacterium sp. LjRoot231 TaxID=3342289 RepID=UPI003ECD8AC7